MSQAPDIGGGDRVNDLTQQQRETFEFAVSYFIKNHQLPPMLIESPSLKYGDCHFARSRIRALASKGYFETNENGKLRFSKKGLHFAERKCGLVAPHIDPSKREGNRKIPAQGIQGADLICMFHEASLSGDEVWLARVVPLMRAQGYGWIVDGETPEALRSGNQEPANAGAAEEGAGEGAGGMAGTSKSACGGRV